MQPQTIENESRIHVCVIFFNVGGYHVARLNAARSACLEQGWHFSAVQIAASTSEHPWGDFPPPEYLTTLCEFQEGGAPSLADSNLLLSHLDQLQPDVVAIPGWGFDFSRIALKWCRTNKRHAVLMSESKHDDAPRSMLKELAKRFISVRHFNAAIVGGIKHREYLNKLGMPNDRIFFGYDIVDNEFFKSGVRRERMHCSDGEFSQVTRNIISVNRFIERKNLDRLIHAFAEFRQKIDGENEWQLVLLGDGPEREKLHQTTKQLGLEDSVLFPGFQPYHEVCSWYAAAEIFVHPALAEQWGLVVNEAMAAGLPTIVSKTCGCFPDLIDEGNTGLGFDPENAEQLCQCLLKLATNPVEAKQIGQAGQRHILENFSPESFGTGICSAVREALSKRNTGRSGDAR